MLTEGKIFGNIILAVSKLEMEQTLPFASVAVQLSWLERPVHTRKVGGSTPLAATILLSGFIIRIIREFSSAGRASALQAEGHRFEPYNSHHLRPGSSVGQNASLSRWRSRVRFLSPAPIKLLDYSKSFLFYKIVYKRNKFIHYKNDINFKLWI